MNMRYIRQLGLGMVAALGFALPTIGQGVAPTDLNGLTHQMADRVRRLGEDISSDLGQTPAGNHLVQDTQELAQAVDDFHESLHNSRDPAQNRQAFAGIESTWQHLRGQLSRGSTPAINRAAARVEQLDAQIRQALALNDPPLEFYGAAQAPSGIADTRRLAHALVDRADALATVIQAEMRGDPNGAALSRDAVELVRLADVFHDTIDANQSIAVAAQAFAPVDVIADRVERYVTSIQVSPRVQSAWQGFASVEVLIHQNLGLNTPQPQLQVSLAPPQAGGNSPIIGLATQLVDNANLLSQTFAQSMGTVPESGAMLDEARRLQAAASNFRQNAARGLAPNQLAYDFREVDASWLRLVRRVNRVARGQTGPVIQRVQSLGGVCEQVHRVLGMPGYAPSYSGFNPNVRRDDDDR